MPIIRSVRSGEGEKEVQSRATSVTASSISPRAWAGVRNRTLELSRWFGRCREKERVKRDSREKGHISEIFPEFSVLRPGTDSGSLRSRVEGDALYIHRVVTDLENRENQENREKSGKM